jgi:hemerythrin superfamily protein
MSHDEAEEKSLFRLIKEIFLKSAPCHDILQNILSIFKNFQKDTYHDTPIHH